MARAAPKPRAAAHFSSAAGGGEDAVAARGKHLDGQAADAGLVPPWISRLSPGCKPARIDDVGPGGEGRFRQARRVHQIHVSGTGRTQPASATRIFGIAAAGQQGADRVADFPVRDAFAQLGEVPDTSMPRIGEAPGGGGYLPARLQQVGIVKAGGRDLDQHFARRPARARGLRATPAGNPGRGFRSVMAFMACAGALAGTD